MYWTYWSVEVLDDPLHPLLQQLLELGLLGGESDMTQPPPSQQHVGAAT